MSKIRDLVPNRVISLIKDHLKFNCNNYFKKTYLSNSSDEDSVTAAFFERISTESPMYYKIGDDYWKFSVEYSTTSSRGKNPLETFIGADVILFIDIELVNGKTFRKGILIQSKMEGKLHRSILEEQIRKMESFVGNSSIVLSYSENSFKCSTGQNYLSNPKRRWRSYSKSFCDFLADEFLECKYGVTNLYYDFDKKEARFIDEENKEILILPQKGVTEIKIEQF